VLDEFSEEPITTVTYTLKRFEFGVPANPTFALKYTQPGTFVRDRTSEEARSSTNHEVSFTVSADGRLLREAASSVRNQIGGRGLGMQFVAVNILLIVGFIVALVYSAKRRTAGKPK
jgi:hypothetical protein